MEIVPGIYRLGDGTANSYFLEESGEVTIVDAGMPGYWDDLVKQLQTIGLDLGAIRAVLLTHAHSDHIGFAERMRAERHVPVWIHEADAALARGEVKPIRDKKAKGGMSIMASLSFFAYGLRNSGLRVPPVTVVSTFGDGATLDMPGSPQVILVPGHTAGSAALHVPARNALFAGDALATRNVLTGLEGPQIAPFGADNQQAFDSLKRLEPVAARYVLPGHGQAWTGGVAGAIAEVRRRGPMVKS